MKDKELSEEEIAKQIAAALKAVHVLNSKLIKKDKNDEKDKEKD
jgi:hypothetical protein